MLKEKKERKTLSGPIKDKARTMQKMVDAVGMVLKEQGYTGLNIANITAKAGVDRRLVSTYFGTIDNLIEEYLTSRDYWMSKVAPKVQEIAEKSEKFGEKEIVKILHTLYDSVESSVDLQRMILWQVSEYNPKISTLLEQREKLGEPLFEATDADFKDTDIDLRAMLAIQIAGIYYLNLQSKSNNVAFCEVNLGTEEGTKRIKNAIAKMMELVYNQGK